MSIQTVNPNTNKMKQSFEELTDSQVDEAVAKAASSYEKWKQTDYKLKAYLPFSGIKGSDNGRALSELGIEEFVNKKLIRIS